MTLPSTMKFVDHGTGGGPEVLSPSSCAIPTPQKGEVLVKVALRASIAPTVCNAVANTHRPPVHHPSWA